MRALLLAALLTPLAAQAEWTERERLLLGATIGVMAVDWGQTRMIAKKPEQEFFEYNPLLGKNPTVGEIDTYFAVAMLATWGTAHLLPNKYRSTFLGAMLLLETTIVIRNHEIGLRMAW